MINKVWKFAKEKHKNQKDDLGKDYFDTHLRIVYEILGKLTQDTDILSAGLLHDILEDTDTTYEELVKKFGENIANLVNELTHEGQKDEKGFYFPRLKSKEAIIIKFADRLSNISRMENWNDKRQEQYLRKSKFWKSNKDEKETNRIKRKILSALKDRKFINIKICKCVVPNSYEMQIGDSQNMDLIGSKGSTGFHNFYIKQILKEIEDEMRGL